MKNMRSSCAGVVARSCRTNESARSRSINRPGSPHFPKSNLSMADEEQQQQQNGSSTSVSSGYRACIPQLVVQAPHASDAISFYKRAFGAEEVARTLHKRKADQEMPLVLHAHLRFGNAEIMLCDEVEESGPDVKSPPSLKGNSTILHVVTDNVDTSFSRALEAGAKSIEDVADQPWGVRYGKVMDPFGFVWSLGTPLKEMQPAQDPPTAAG